ncbi:MAG: hypothetical protein ACYC1Q_04385 [Bacteroidia bacterium]
METSWLIARLDNPALLQKGDEQRLRELIASYPYFSAPYLLLARSLHEQKHPAFEQLLPLISLQAFDRKRLFRLIHEESMDHRPWTMAEEETRGRGDEEMGRLGDEENDMVRHLSEEPVLSLPKESMTDEPESSDEEMRGLGDDEEGRRGDEETGRLGDEENDMVRHAERSRSKTDEPETPEEENIGIENVGAEHFLPDPDVETKLQSPGANPRFAVNFSEIEKTSEEPVQTVHDELQEIPFLLSMDHSPWTIVEEEREAVPAAGAESEVEVEVEAEADVEVDVEEMRGLGDEEEGRRGDLETGRQGDEENDRVRHLSEEPVLSLPKESATDMTETTDKEVSLHGSAPLTMAEDQNPESNPQSPTPNAFEKVDFLHWLQKLQPVKKDEEMRGFGDEEEGRRGDLETGRQGDEENDRVRQLSEEPVLSLPKESATVRETKDLQPAAYSLQPDPDPNALIDKFIETNPSVSRVKERFYDPAVQAKESERLDDNLMTETLARIFVKQEKYERAIDAYRKLQLKYPEKSDYFAALILEINSKIN